MVPEAPLERTEHGLSAAGEGWFILNARDAQWRDRPARGVCLYFEGKTEFEQIGIRLFALGPGEPMSMYHWEADQEDFLVLEGEALLIVEGEERQLRRWDFFHCPPHTGHVIVGAGTGRCIVVAVGARTHAHTPDWGGYPVDETALRHGAGVEEETNDVDRAYARFADPGPTSYGGWLG